MVGRLVRRQMLLMLREINRIRKVAGKKQLPTEILPLRRRVVRPFAVTYETRLSNVGE